jgi:hypothetical protein
MEAKLQEALASWPRNADGALLNPETAKEVAEGVWVGEVLPDGKYPVTAADGTVMEFEVKNEVQPKAEAGAEQAQAGQAEAGAEQPGLADLPAPGASDMDKAAEGASPEGKDAVLTAMRDAVGSRIMAASGFDVDAGGADAALINAVDKLAQITPADFARNAPDAPREPSHAARLAGEQVSSHTDRLAKAGAAAGAGGPSR